MSDESKYPADFDPHEVAELFETAWGLESYGCICRTKNRDVAEAHGLSAKGQEWWDLIEHRFTVAKMPAKLIRDEWCIHLIHMMLCRRHELARRASSLEKTKRKKNAVQVEELLRQIHVWTERITQVRAAASPS